MINVDALNQQYTTTESILRYAVDTYGDGLCLASSLGAEDQVLTDMLCAISNPVHIVVLDTGRLHQETYDVMANSAQKYGIQYDVYTPDTEALEAMLRQHGPNHFYQQVAHRKQCCRIRKVDPLNRALSNYQAWITGVRRAQSMNRALMNHFEWDESHGMLKINPLAMWSQSDVWDYIKRYDVPYNVLHDRGFPSIGCEPCTRSVNEGDDPRSGRWWWEDAEKKECGLHVHNEESNESTR